MPVRMVIDINDSFNVIIDDCADGLPAMGEAEHHIDFIRQWRAGNVRRSAFVDKLNARGVIVHIVANGGECGEAQKRIIFFLKQVQRA